MERYLNFKEKILDAFSILIPDSMKIMPKELAAIKYPSEFRPQKIITSLDLSVNFGFSIFSNDIQNKDIIELVERIRVAIHRANSDCIMYEYDLFQKNGGSWFAFRSHAMDSDLYNMMCVVPIEKGVVQGSFNCMYPDYPKWKPVVLMMWETITNLKKELSGEK